MIARRELGVTLVQIALLTTVAVGAGLAAGAGIITPQTFAVGGLVILACGLAFIAIRRHGTALHPCTIIGILVMANGLLGYALYPGIRESGPAPELYSFSNAQSVATLELFLIVASTVLAVGAVAPRAAVTYPGLRIRLGAASRSVRTALLLGVVGAALAYFVGSNISALVVRDTYHGFSEEGGIIELLRLGNGLHIPAILVTWVFILSGESTRWERRTAGAALLVFFLLDFATSSRTLMLFPLLLLLAYWLTRGRLPSFWSIAVGVAAALALYSAALELRGAPKGDHGLVPYARQAFTEPGQVFVSEVPRLEANALNGFPKATYVLERTEVRPSAVWASLNPLPSREIGFSVAGQGLSVRSYIPFSTIGIMGNLGTLIAMAYFGIIGIVLALLWSFGHSTMARAAVGRTVVVGAAFAIGLMSLQYTLRTTFRLTTTIVVLAMAFLWFMDRRGKRPAEGTNRPGSSLIPPSSTDVPGAKGQPAS